MLSRGTHGAQEENHKAQCIINGRTREVQEENHRAQCICTRGTHKAQEEKRRVQYVFGIFGQGTWFWKPFRTHVDGRQTTITTLWQKFPANPKRSISIQTIFPLELSMHARSFGLSSIHVYHKRDAFSTSHRTLLDPVRFPDYGMSVSNQSTFFWFWHDTSRPRSWIRSP